MRSYKRKMVVSGNIFEIYEYEKPVFYDMDCMNPLGRSVTCSDASKIEDNRDKVLKRARTDIRRKINCNVDMYGVTTKFITFTFADNVQDIDVANMEWKNFRRRAYYYFDKDLKYITVIEFQKRGAIHFHSVFFNMPYVRSDKLSELWGNGFIKINKLDNVDNVGAYVCKYLTKDTYQDVRLRGKKSYFCSRGLYKPIEIVDEKRIDEIAAHLSDDEKVYENYYQGDYNSVLYKQYNTSKQYNTMVANR